jgi:hypothetical protein
METRRPGRSLWVYGRSLIQGGIVAPSPDERFSDPDPDDELPEDPGVAFGMDDDDPPDEDDE